MSFSQSIAYELSTTAISPLFSRPSPSSKTGDFEVIPPNHASRTLVLCFHSVNSLAAKYDSSNSIVKTFCDLLVRDDQQIVYEVDSLAECQDLGSSSDAIQDKLVKFLGKYCGIDFRLDVISAYNSLASSYQPGDKISLFGFSRGAYAARALAEMIHKVGLLPKTVHLDDDVWLADLVYVFDLNIHDMTSAKFKELKPFRVCIDFVGVWDTVISVADVIALSLPFARSNTSIRVFRHALALHEPRARFRPKFYEQQFDAWWGAVGPDVQEVWFAGGHCDVGGCAVPKGTPHSLGRIPLRWMVRECFRASTGIRFHTEGLKEIGLDPASLYPIVQDPPRPLQPQSYHFNSVAPCVPTASEEQHDVRDALSPMHDQFTVLALLWWILELLPIWRRVPVGPPSKLKESEIIRMSLPRGLSAPEDRPGCRSYVHPTVRTRMQAGL